MAPLPLPSFMKQIMDSMGWTDTSYIPVANQDNRQLLENIDQLMKDKLERANYLQNLDIRVQQLTDHKKNAEQDVKQNLNLIATYRSQHATETNMLQLAEREDSKLHSQIKEIQKEYDEMKKYEKKTENDIEYISKNIEKNSNKINWTKTCLMEWRQAMIKGEETNNLIKKYCKEDESKAISLDNRRRLMQDQINKQKVQLIELYEEQKSLEQTLDRTAELYRQAHLERQQLINTWKDAVNQMNQRENDIIETEKYLDEAVKETKHKEEKLKEQEAILNEQILNNKEIEIEMNDLNHEISVLRQHLEDSIDSVALKENELDIARKSFQNLAQKLQQQRKKNQQLIKDKIEKEKEIEQFDNKYEELKKRYDKFRIASSNATERIKQFDEMIDSEEKIKQQLTKDITRLNNLYYRTQLQINSMKDLETQLTNDNQGLEINIKTIKSEVRDAEKELPKLTVITYDLNFKIGQIKLRIARVQGIVPESDESEKQEKLLKLKNNLEIRLTEFNQLESKIMENEEDLKVVAQCYSKDMNEIEKVKSKIKELQLYCEGGERQLNDIISENHEKIAELSIIKIRINEMEKQIEKHEDKAYSLEKHRLELENAIRKRLTDIQAQKKILFIKKKHLLEEKNTLKADIGERSIKIEALKKRHDLSVELLGKNDDGSSLTATQIKIAAAQEKQMLLQEGNELNEKVLRAEDDIKATENTLALINYSNDSYKRTFEKVDENNPEVQELSALQDNYAKTVIRLKNLKICLTNRTQNLEESIEKRDEIEKDLEEACHMRMERNEILLKIQKELSDQLVKISRAERELKMAHRGARHRCLDPDYLVKYEKDLSLRELEEKNMSGLQLLADFIDVNIELAPIITQLLYEKGIKIPQQVIRCKSQQTICRSEYSDYSTSETSLRIFSASSRASSIVSSSSSKNLKTTGSAPSVVSIDFPSENVTNRQRIQKKKFSNK